jgi:hypothetical protein
MRVLTQARQAAGTEGGAAAAGWLKRASMVAEVIGVEDEVAVPGLPLDTLGDPLVEADDSCGAPIGYVSMVSATRSDDFNASAGIKGRRTRAWGCADGKGEGGRRRREVEGAIDGTKGLQRIGERVDRSQCEVPQWSMFAVQLSCPFPVE